MVAVLIRAALAAFLLALGLAPGFAGYEAEPRHVAEGGTGLRSCVGPFIGVGISGYCGQMPGQWLAPGAAAANLGFTPLNPAANLADLADPAAALVNLGIAGAAPAGFGFSTAPLGFAVGGDDNAGRMATLLGSLAYGGFSAGPIVFSPAASGVAEYYFSQPIHVTKPGLKIACGGAGFRSSDVALVFAAGVDGLVDDGSSDISGCKLFSLGFFTTHAGVTSGSATIAGIGGLYPTAISQPGFAAGDGVIVKGMRGGDAPLAVPAGAYVASASGSTIVLASGFEPTATSIGDSALYRLPAALALTVDLTAGSNAFTVTAGTTLLKPGDMVWAPGIPFGSTVFTVSGPAGAQTVTLRDAYLTGTASAQAAATLTGAKLWTVPAGFNRRNSDQSHSLYVVGFPIGMKMACSNGFSEPLVCGSSQDDRPGVESALVGRWTAGNTTAANLELTGVYTRNFRMDVFAGGVLGEAFLSTGLNSAENGWSFTSALLNCWNSNETIFVLPYFSGDSAHPVPVCANQTDAYGGAPALPNPFVNVGVIIGNQAGYTPAGSLQFAANGSFEGRQVKFGRDANCLWTGGNAYIADGATNPYNWMVSSNCGTNAAIGFGYDAASGSYGFRTPNYPFNIAAGVTKPAGSADVPWQGRATPGYAAMWWMPGGFFLNGPGAALGTEKWVFASSAAPTPSATTLRGDVAIATAPSAGGFAEWVETADNTAFTPAAPVALDTAGTTWAFQFVRHPPVPISGLPACNAASAGTDAWVSNGVAAPAWRQAVGATTGPATEPVHCITADGSAYAWVY